MSAGHSPNVRRTVYERDGWACCGCGFRQTPEEVAAAVAALKRGRPIAQYLTIDHIVPRSKGGSERLENLQTLCNICNGVKADSLDPADAIPIRLRRKVRQSTSKMLAGLHRSRSGRMLLHDPRCDATFCIDTCPVYLERGVFL